MPEHSHKTPRPAHDYRSEAMGLQVSIAGNFLMVFLGLGFAVATDSGAVLLDGVYSAIAFIMALAAKRISTLVEQRPTERFPFGYMHFEPFFNTLRSLLIVVISLFAFVSAIMDLAAGGRAIHSKEALVYGIICTLCCFGISFYQKALCQKTLSPLLDLDSKSWMIDGVLSATATAAFLTALLLEGSSQSGLAVYVDPVLIILLVGIILPVPFRLLAGAAREVFQVAPPASFRRDVEDRIEKQVRALGLRKTDIRMVRIGRFLYVLIYLVLDSGNLPVSEADRVRQDIADAIESPEERLILDVVFTTREKWLQENQTKMTA